MKSLLLLPLAALTLASPSGLFSRNPSCQQCYALPELNKCDATTSCVSITEVATGDGPIPAYCACRAGYKTDPTKFDPRDPTLQFRLPWASQQGRVFVRPGVACDTLCEHWELGKDGCQEVPVRSECTSSH